MTAESSEARAAQLKETVDGAIERLAGQLAQGHTDEYRQLLAFWSRFHRYRHANVLLILSQRPDATQVAGYHAWRKIGRQARKRPKAVATWCPIVKTVENPETGLPVEHCVGLTPCPDFAAQDLVDIETNPFPTLWRPLADDVPGLCGQLRKRIDAAGYPAAEAGLPPGREGDSGEDRRITVAAGLDSRNRTLVLLHELAHQLEHFKPERAEASREQGELEAESAAVVVAAMLGLEHPIGRDYILSYRGDAARCEPTWGALAGGHDGLGDVIRAVRDDDLGSHPASRVTSAGGSWAKELSLYPSPAPPASATGVPGSVMAATVTRSRGAAGK